MQSGAELTYLLRHDPDFRRVRHDDLIEVGHRIRLKRNIALLAEFLKDGIDGFRFDFYVVSAAPWLVVHSALDGTRASRSHHRRALRLQRRHG